MKQSHSRTQLAVRRPGRPSPTSTTCLSQLRQLKISHRMESSWKMLGSLLEKNPGELERRRDRKY